MYNAWAVVGSSDSYCRQTMWVYMAASSYHMVASLHAGADDPDMCEVGL